MIPSGIKPFRPIPSIIDIYQSRVAYQSHVAGVRESDSPPWKGAGAKPKAPANLCVHRTLVSHQAIAAAGSASLAPGP